MAWTRRMPPFNITGSPPSRLTLTTAFRRHIYPAFCPNLGLEVPGRGELQAASQDQGQQQHHGWGHKGWSPNGYFLILGIFFFV